MMRRVSKAPAPANSLLLSTVDIRAHLSPLCVIFALCVTRAAFALDATVNWNDVKQKITGFGASSAFCAQECMYGMPEPARTQAMDFLFDTVNGMGLSIVRAGVNTSNASGEVLLDQDGTWHWEYEDAQAYVLKEAKKRGVTQFWAAPWSPPPWMKTSNSKIGGSLLPQYYQAYADFISTFITEYKSRHGIDFMGLSPQNEPHFNPSWVGCYWTPTQLASFCRILGPTLARKNPGVTLIAPETNQCSNCLNDYPQTSYADSIFNNPVLSTYTGVVAFHKYEGSIGHYAPAQSKGKEYWQTETSISSSADDGFPSALNFAQQLHEYMTIANANAWHYWWLMQGSNDNQALVRGNRTSGTFIKTKRAWFLAHVSRFVRPGWYMIGVSPYSFTNQMFVHAYKNPTTGDFAVIVVNNDWSGPVPCTITFQGCNVTSVTTYLTRGDQDINMQKQTNVPVTNGKITVTPNNVSIMTITGKAPEVTSIIPQDGRNLAAMTPPQRYDGPVMLFDLHGRKIGRLADAGLVKAASTCTGQGAFVVVSNTHDMRAYRTAVVVR